MHIDRRHFCFATLAAVAAAVTRPASGTDGDAAYAPHTLAHPDLLPVLGADTIREIGRRYREIAPVEHDAAALHAAVRATRASDGRRAPLAAVVTDDFASGRTVLVNGWVLAATEARQCALFSLLPA